MPGLRLFYLVIVSQLYICNSQCDSYCVSCNGTKCSKCQDNYRQLYNGCIKCIDGFYGNGYNCEFCPRGCSKCNSKTQCIQCQEGYQLNNFVCVNSQSGSEGTQENKCPHCIFCDGDQCLSCENSNYKIIDGKCVTCDVNCDTCIYGKCYKCKTDDYALDNNNQCKSTTTTSNNPNTTTNSTNTSQTSDTQSTNYTNNTNTTNQTNTTSENSDGSDSSPVLVIVLTVVGGCILILIISFICYRRCKKRQIIYQAPEEPKPPSPRQVMKEIQMFEVNIK